MDQAAGWGKVRVGVDIHSAMVAGVPTSGGSDPNRFTVTDFQVDTARTTCTCPNGVVSTKAYPHGDSDGLSLSPRHQVRKNLVSWRLGGKICPLVLQEIVGHDDPINYHRCWSA